MLHGENGKLEPHHAADLARPQAPGVDHVLGVNAALLGNDVPAAVRARLHVGDAVVAVDLRAADAGGLGVSVGDAGGIDVSLHRVVKRADEVFFLHQRKALRRFVHSQEFGLHAEVAPAGVGGF